MELIELEKQLEALQEQIKSMKSADESCDKLTEAEDEKIETEEEKVEETETPEVEDVETEEDKEIVEFKPEETEEVVDDNAVLVDNISKELLRSLMSILDDINLIGENLEDDKYIAVFDEVKEHVNKAIGSVQAVIADGSEDAQIQDEAREEAENIIDDANDQSLDADANEDDVEIIKPVDGEEEEEIEEVSEEDVEESFEISHDKKLNEDLQIIIGFHDYEPWSGAKDTYNYIMEQYGWDESAVESVLEEIFPDGCTDTELNDFFWFDDNIYEIFGVKDPYAENEDDENDEDEEEEIEEVEESCNPDDIDESTHKCHRR